MLQTQPVGSKASRWVDFIFLLFIALSSVKLMGAIAVVADIGLSDEAAYLTQGARLLSLGFPQAAFSPLYAIWYWSLSLLVPDLIDLYYFNHQLLVFLLSILVYIFLRTIKVNPFISAIFTFTFLISSIPFIWPRPSHFALLLLLIFLISAFRSKERSSHYWMMALGFLAIAFARPEYSLTYLAFSALFIYSTFQGIRLDLERNAPSSKRSSIKKIFFSQAFARLFLFLIASIAALLVFGNPLAGSRSWIAFGQHFAFNWVHWNQSDLDPWQNWQEILSKVFGADTDSIGGAILADPILFARHLLANFIKYLSQSINILLVDFRSLSLSVSKTVHWVQVSGLIATLLLLLKNRIRLIEKISLEIQSRETLTRLLIGLACLLLSVLPSVILVYPRDHYLILQGIYLIAILAYLISCLPILDASNSASPRSESWIILSAIVASSLIFLCVPSIAYGWCIAPNTCAFDRTSSEIAQPELQVIQFVKRLNIQDPVILLDRSGYWTYLTENYQPIQGNLASIDQQKGGFQNFLKENKINMVLVTPATTRTNEYSQDPSFLEFLQQPDKFGFLHLGIPTPDSVLSLEKSLFEKSEFLKEAYFPLKAGDLLDFSKPEFRIFQGQGWSVTDREGSWMQNDEASLNLRFAEIPASGLRFAVRLSNVFLHELQPSQSIEVLVNNEVVDRWEFRLGTSKLPIKKRFVVSQELLTRRIPAIITFRLQNAKSPAELGISPDGRKLGFMLRLLRISEPSD